MTVKDILAMTGEDFNTMDRKELVEVDRILAGAARKRLKALPTGFAYNKLLRRANNTVNTGTQKTLFMKQGQIKIATPKTASMQDLRALRKELFSYLKDPTSTKTGYKQVKTRMFKELLSRFRDDVEEYYKTMPKDEVEKWETITIDLANISSNSDLLDFGNIHLGWTSGNNGYKVAIESCGGYAAMHSGDPVFTENLKRYIEEQITEKTQQAREKLTRNNLVSHEENMNNIMEYRKNRFGL